MAVTEVLVVYLHIAAMILIAVFLAIEYLMCVPGLAREKVKLLARIDLLYLIAAAFCPGYRNSADRLVRQGRRFLPPQPGLLPQAGAVRRRWIDFHSPDDAVSALDAHAQDRRRCGAADFEVLRARRYVLAELVLFAFIPLLAVLMARGIGIQVPAS